MGPSHVVRRQCPLCEAHCGIRVEVAGDPVLRIDGDPGDVLSHGYICPKATALSALHEDPERLRTPMRRVGERFEPVSWEEAFGYTGERLRSLRRRHGRDAVGAYFGNPTAHSSAVFAIEGLERVLRSRNSFSAATLDQFPQYLAAELVFGDHTILPVIDIERTSYLLVLGASPCGPSAPRRYAARSPTAPPRRLRHGAASRPPRSSDWRASSRPHRPPSPTAGWVCVITRRGRSRTGW